MKVPIITAGARPYRPVVLIGAARSGTKLLRDLIADHPKVNKVPYDIDYIWQFGNEHLPHGELLVGSLTPAIQERILNRMESFSSSADFLLEKSVSNCLRVPFVDAVFSNAYFIHLIRHGFDVVESAYRQWMAPPDWGYIIRRASSFPLTEAFGYALSYASATFTKLISPANGKARIWGPRYDGIYADVASKDLIEVCSIQWARCVERAVSDLGDLSHDRVRTIRYEDIVLNPRDQLLEIAQFLDIDPNPYLDVAQRTNVTQENVGKGIRNLRPEQLNQIMPHIESTLSLLNYSSSVLATYHPKKS